MLSPSILLITIDTLRADHVGCYGSRAATTPNIDRLAREGVRFDEARSHVPLTLPSHATMLTGLLPPRHGLRANGLSTLRPDVATVASVLEGKGYKTGAVVASVVLDRAHGLDRGFDLYDDNQRVGDKRAFEYLERGASQIAEAAERQLRSLDPPFFLWVHLYDPHAPWVAPESLRRRHPDRGYDAEIAFADQAVGAIRERATARAGGGLVVAVTADHGESLGEHGEAQHGYTLHRAVLRVPLVIAGPGIPRGMPVGATVGLVDLGPTLADLAGASMPGVDGRSLRPLWSGTAVGGPGDSGGAGGPLWEESLHPLFDSGWAPLRGLLTSRWHFVDAPRPELYDRAADPGDRRDVAARNPAIVKELRARLSERMRVLGDVPEPIEPVPHSAEDRERLERIGSLGYLSGGTMGPVPARRLDPKDGLPGYRAIEEADRLLEAGKGKEARTLLLPFTRKDPRNPRLWHQLGKAWVAEGNLTEARRALETAVALDPRSAFVRYTYAAVLQESGETAAAGAQYRAILDANPRAVDAALDLAALAVGERRFDEAERIVRAAYDAGGRDADLLDLLGSFAAQKGRHDEAESFFAQALALRPDDVLALLETGRAALRRGDSVRAIDRLGRCTEGPKAYECRIELARAYVVGPRDLTRARAALESAMSVAGNDDRRRQEVRRRLDALGALPR